jgi:glycosyltransferase involved in cell wall biosynthesis
MRIAHIAPAWISIPPKKYGGTENVISTLIEEQIAQGHDVTLFSPGDAKTSAKLVSFFSHSLFESGVPWQAHLKAYYHLHKAVDYLKKHTQDFDIVHTHLSSSSDMYVFPLTASLALPHVTTLHSCFPFDCIDGQWTGDADLYYMEWVAKSPLVAISQSARQEAEKRFPLNFVGVVHHGIALDDFVVPQNSPEDFFVWLGRLAPEKGAHAAIEVAKRANVPLILAGIVDYNIAPVRRYFQEQIEPQIDGKQIKYIGPVDMQQKIALLSRARAMLNPIQWEEPFGMVMIEAMATGCPVIGFKRGATAEIIKPGIAGFVVENVDEMVARIQEIESIDRQAVRQYVKDNFSVYTMTRNYTGIYWQVIAEYAERFQEPFSLFDHSFHS